MSLCQVSPTACGAGHREWPLPRVSYVEARSGLARACRTGRISSDELREAVEGLEVLDRRFHHVEITPDLVTSAGDLAEEVALRGL